MEVIKKNDTYCIQIKVVNPIKIIKRVIRRNKYRMIGCVLIAMALVVISVIPEDATGGFFIMAIGVLLMIAGNNIKENI